MSDDISRFSRDPADASPASTEAEMDRGEPAAWPEPSWQNEVPTPQAAAVKYQAVAAAYFGIF